MNGCDPCMKKRQFKNYRMERTLYIVNSGINIVLFAFYNLFIIFFTFMYSLGHALAGCWGRTQIVQLKAKIF